MEFTLPFFRCLHHGLFAWFLVYFLFLAPVLSTLEPAQPGWVFSSVSRWNSPDQSLSGSWFRKTLSWEHILTFLILQAYFHSHYSFPARLCLFSLYICKSNLFISTSQSGIQSILQAPGPLVFLSKCYFKLILYSGRLWVHDIILHMGGYLNRRIINSFRSGQVIQEHFVPMYHITTS